MTEEQQRKAVFLPVEFYTRIEERVKSRGFGSVDEYVVFVLEEILKEESQDSERDFSKEDEEEVKKRLKALGYLG